jgi:hypothetical protein
VNLLMLAGPLYMLQVYDRVLSSRSVPALVALSIFLVGAYGIPGRSRSDPLAILLDQRLARRPMAHAAPPCRCECQILRLPYPRPIRRMVAA